MATKILKIKTNREFGENGCFFCRGMKAMEDGISPQWEMRKVSVKTGDSIANNNNFTDIINKGEDDFFAVNNDQIYQWEASEWQSIHNVAGRNIGFDRNDNLIYPQGSNVGQGILNGSWAWTDAWKSWTEHGTYHPVENWEDFTFIGNGYEIAGFTGDGTDWSANLFSLPSNFSIRKIKSGKNGILIGANQGMKSWLILWDGYSSGAMTPWIPMSHRIIDITKYEGQWIVLTEDGYFYVTNGYSIKKLTNFEGLDNNIGYYGGIEATRDYLFVSVGHGGTLTTGGVARRLAGIYVYNFKTGLWSYNPFSDSFYSHAGALGLGFYQGAIWIMTTYADDLDSGKVQPMRLEENESWDNAFYIAPLIQNESRQLAEAIIAKLQWLTGQDNNLASTYPLTVRVKIAGNERILFTKGQTVQASADKTKVIVDGTKRPYNNAAEEGDEITFLGGSNTHHSRHIKEIQDKGENPETWVMEEAFKYDIDNNAYLIISPFQLVGEREVYGGKLEEMYFEVLQKIMSRDFWLKVEFEDLQNRKIKYLKLNELDLVLTDQDLI